MKETVKLTPNDKKNWTKNHTLTSEQRHQLITQKLERARQQFEALAKTPVLA